MRTVIRRSAGMARVVLHLVRGATTMAIVFPFIGEEQRRRIIKRWSDGVLDIFGLKLELEGTPPGATPGLPIMLVGNHISWVDIYAYLSVTEVKFVAKSEVKAWPLIGWFATNLGTIFVERDRPRDAARVSNEVRGALEAGHRVCVFPEGTTTDGSVVLPFSSVLMSAAIDKGVAVQPVAIAYHRPDGGICSRAAFTGDDTLVASLWQLAGGGQSIVKLAFLEPIKSGSMDRRLLSRQAEDAIRARLNHPLRLSAGGNEQSRTGPLPRSAPNEAATAASPGSISG
jgi:1-acyl-sn-glycerol-3-phosphate acyltransferase